MTYTAESGGEEVSGKTFKFEKDAKCYKTDNHALLGDECKTTE